MKKNKFSLAFAMAALLSVVAGCNKDVPSQEILTPLASTNVDANAGAWKMIFLDPTLITVAAPADLNSASYQAELASIKAAQANLTSAQRAVIDYWSGGGVLRWNQIFRELVARYNLPPAPLPDDSYIFPDSENPFGDPQFPFANPPYAARAYSYLSVAQADAMKITWKYKYQFNRPAPYVNDAGVQALVPKTSLPAYPSEDAVLSGVTAEVLKVLFPGAIEEITLKAADQRNAAKWSGKASDSDIASGLSLGKAVATVLTAASTGTFPITCSYGSASSKITLNLADLGRFRTDGMATAIGTKAQWQALADNTAASGQVPWKSLESPARPPMLPYFGNVKAWMMTPDNIVSERPAPPPSTSSAEMQAQLSEVKFYAENQTRERIAIVHKWADGAGTYTPPGHWNDIAEEYIRDANFSEVRAARAFALLNMAMHNAAVGCWDTKYYYFNPRPTQLDPSIKTSTGIPNFPAYTSGHSTFSAAAATVLSYLFPSGTADFEEQAKEASLSRLYGAIHYRIDTEIGMQHGKRIASYTISFATQDGAN